MTVIHMNCIEGMRMLPAGQVDAIVTDPPYGDTSLVWDKQCRDWIPEAARILKPIASFWVFGSLRFLAPLFADMNAAGFKYAQDLVWEKQNGSGFHADRFRRVHEHAVHFYRGAWANLHRETQYTADATAKTVRRKTRPTHTGHIDAGHYVSEDGGPRMMRSVLQIRNEHGRAVHPTQKPLDLLRPIIRFSVPPDGVVLDPFAGSGSTLVAAKEEGRTGIGFELQPEYVAIANARIDAVTAMRNNTAS